MRTTPRQLIALALAATFTLAIAGCAGDESPSEQTTESTDASETPAGD